MNIRFDDSLPILADVIRDRLGSDMLASGVALRDSSGRLAFFAAGEIDDALIETISQQLREKLGPYARTDRVLARYGDFGAARILDDPAALSISVKGNPIRLLDRRLVGTDWQRPPTEAALPPPRLVFASLKGGVGRSTALAIVAADLASQGHRVLALDLDIEAPGLGPMLLNEDTLPEFGVLDALVENGLSGLDEVFLADLIGPSALAEGRGRIDVIPVLGRRSLCNPADVLAKIARAYTEDVDTNGKIATFMDQTRSLVDRLADPKRYDVVLVDARAGLHETTASAVLGLGAEVFLFGRDEPQTFQGFKVLLSHLARFIGPAGAPPEWLTRFTLVQGQAPLKPETRAAFAEKCSSLVIESGLGPRANTCPPPSAPDEPFSDIPWDDELPDEAVLPYEDWGLRNPIAILDDPRFRGFDPHTRRDLLAEQIYCSTFGQLLEQVRMCLASTDEEPSL